MKRIAFAGLLVASVFCGPACARAEYSWQKPQAKVLPTGDLEWAPKPFEFVAGDEVRYIDFENGDDANDGKSKQTPWKHHPWDENAAGKAAEASGPITYVFKRGVTYRGFLQAGASGEADNPVRLTSDPEWGEGGAILAGSMRVTGGWKQATDEDVPEGMPESGKVWYRDLGTEFEPWAMWEVKGDNVSRIPIARDPNWERTNPADPKSEWDEWTWPSKEERRIGTRAGVDEDLKGKPKDFFKGVYCWSEWGGGVWGAMSLQYRSPITEYDPEKGSLDRVVISPIFDGWVVAGDRYFLEKHPSYLDVPGEYYYEAPGHWMPKVKQFPWEGKYLPANAEHAGRLYVRLPGDRNPNEATIEIGKRDWILRILDQSHIEVSGLAFRFTNVPYRPQNPDLPGWDSYDIHLQIALEPYLHPAAVMLGGDTNDIRIANNTFRHVACAVKGKAWRSPTAPDNQVFPPLEGQRFDEFGEIKITDNDIQYIDHEGISLRGNLHAVNDGPKLGRVWVLRNRLYHISLRPKQSKNSPAIYLGGGATLAEVAGNEMKDCIGMGIYTVGGKSGGDERTFPLVRMMIYNNRADHVMLGANDWGAIAAWQGGPSYVFNNVASNAIGYKNHVYRTWEARDKKGDLPRYVSNAYPYYGDGTYKSYWFNNIAYSDYDAATSPYRSQAAFMYVLGFQNYIFNNSAYNFNSGSSGSIGNRGGYLGNILARTNRSLLSAGARGDLSVAGGGEEAVDLNMGAISTVGFAQNLLADTLGAEFMIRLGVGTWRDNTLEKRMAALKEAKPLVGQVGTVVKETPFQDPEGHDFRPNEVADQARGVRNFAPWGLYATVGEWQFRSNLEISPQVVFGEHFFMTDEYVTRQMYYEIPRSDLSAPNATEESYVPGKLNNWLEAGAMVFDGEEDYAQITHASLTRSYGTSYGFYDRKQEGKPVTRAEGKPLRDMLERLEKLKKTDKTKKIERLKKAIEKAKAQGRPMEFIYPGEKRRTLNINTGNLLVEAYLKTQNGHTGGVIAGKMGENGYQLALDDEGKPSFIVAAGGDRESFIADGAINDGEWHHVLAEMDRVAGKVRIYVDGKGAGEFDSELPADASMANQSDFLVGRSPGDDYFAGTMDFLRVCRGTLADAQTTIDELYAWQFVDGPHLEDFTGQKRDFTNTPAGAIDYR